MYVATSIFMQRDRNIILYFRERNATSPDTAVEFKQEDFGRINATFARAVVDLSKSRPVFIKATGNNTYYLDENELRQYQKRSQRAGGAMVAGAILFLAIAYLLLHSHL